MRELGSGNPGAANAFVEQGLRRGLFVLLGDILKTMLACGLCCLLFPVLAELALLYGGLGVMLGHCFPLWLRFRGGQGVAAFASLLFLLSPPACLLCLLLALFVLLLSRYAVLATLSMALAFAAFALWRFSGETALLACLCAGLLLLRQLPGLIRLLRGQGNKTEQFSRLAEYWRRRKGG